MSSRNPSRPLPGVKNQFRPAADWIGHINDRGICPYNPKHDMKSHKLMKHAVKCEKKEEECEHQQQCSRRQDELEKCPFDSLHRYAAGKQEEHFKECKARAAEIIARINAGEAIGDVDLRYEFPK